MALLVASPDLSNRSPRNPFETAHEAGDINIAAGSTPQAGVTTTPEKMTGFEANGVSTVGVVPDFANNEITVNVTGIYDIRLSVSFSGTANSTWDFLIAVNGVATRFGLQRKIGAGGDVGDTATYGSVELQAGDIVSVLVNSDQGGGASFTPVYAIFGVARQGDA
jgi:hypothetical protein